MSYRKLFLIALALAAIAIPAAELGAATEPDPSIAYCSGYDQGIGEGGQAGAGCWRQEQHACGFFSSVPCYMWGDCSYCADLGQCIRCELGSPEPDAAVCMKSNSSIQPVNEAKPVNVTPAKP